MPPNTTYQPNFALLAGLVWLAIVGQLLWLGWAQTGQLLGDTDDAMRLVEVRAFLAGRGWFDLHEPRLQPPLGYDTHWSRLIDAGLAGLFLIFRLGTDSALAERLMRVVWPLLWLAPAMAGTLALAWRLAGRPAALVALVLLLFGLPAFQQFWPGRIDHHDVQITLAGLTLAAAVWADRVPWAAWAAGALSGLALAIGVEGLPFIALAGAALAMRYALDRNFAPVLAAYGWSIAASVALAFLISVPPNHWTQTACDAIAINSAAPAILGGLTLGIAGRWGANESLLARCVAVAIALSLAAAVFVLIDPRCLAGPMAMVDPAVRPIWFNRVSEVQPLLAISRQNLASGFGIAVYPIAAAFSAIVLARQTQVRRDFGFIVIAAALIVAIAMTIVAVRGAPYTMWLGMPFVAAALLRLFTRLKLVTLPMQALVAILFTPALLSFGVIAIMESISPPANSDREGRACLEIANYAPLARLPAGLMITDIDYGPFLLALTPHSILAAPYHRASYGIVTNYRALTAPPDEAREILRRAHAAYVMICTLRPRKELPDAERQRSLRGQLEAGLVPNWLEAMPKSGPLAVYRLRPQ